MLQAAVFLCFLIGVIHSLLGERFILVRLFRGSQLPHLLGSDVFTKGTLRFAWHITTIAWWGLGYIIWAIATNAENLEHVVLYTVGEHRMTYPGSETWYANKISASELSAISSRFPAVGAELAAGDFLTKLVREYSPSQMSADLVLTPAGADDEFRLVNYSGFPLFNLLLGGSLLGWLGMRVTLWRRKSRKVVEIGQ